VRLHQSIKFKYEKDSFDFQKAVQNELKLSKIACPRLAEQVFPARDPARISAPESHIKVDLTLKNSPPYVNSTPDPLEGRQLFLSKRDEKLEDAICSQVLRK
jgi:hypothetical protein